MSATAVELKRMQTRIRKLENEIAQMQRVMRERGILPGVKQAMRQKGKSVALRNQVAISENERAVEILRRAGLLSEPTAREKQLVAEWCAVPLDERTRLVEEFRASKLDRPLSQIVIENRR